MAGLQCFGVPCFASPEAAWAALSRRVDDALDAIPAIFYCGLLGGIPASDVFRAMSTELVLMEDTGQYKPRLEPTGPTTFLLRIPKYKLNGHSEVMMCAYLLRAHAHYWLQGTEPDPAKLNKKAWQFLEAKMFGHMPILMNKLMEIGSIEQLHRDGVPMSLLLGYMANHRPGFQLSSRFSVVPYNEIYIPSLPVSTKSRRILGSGQHEPLVSKLVDWLRRTGRFDIRSTQNPTHIVLDDYEGAECFVVSSLHSELLTEKDSEPVGALMRTVVCSNDLSSGRLFEPLLSGAVLH